MRIVGTQTKRPSVPANVAASDGGETAVTVTWSASSRATGYRVYRSTTAGTQGTQIATTTSTSYADATVISGVVYYYGVTATNRWGESALSTQNSGYIDTVTPPPSVSYYVDQTGGADSNAGTSTGAAWKTIAKVNASSFAAGEQILFKRGETWAEGRLTISGKTGAAGTEIVYGAYGAGNDPIIDAAGDDFCIWINNSSYVTVQDIYTKSAVFNNVNIITSTGGDVRNILIQRVTAEESARYSFYCEASPANNRHVDDVIYRDCVALRAGVGGGVYSTGFYAYNIWGTTDVIYYYNCQSLYAGQAPTLGHGFSSTLSYGIHWIGCESAYTNIDPDTGLSNGILGEGHGFAFDDFSHGGTITHCYSHDNLGAGIAGAHQSDGNLIAYNVVANNQRYGIVINGAVGGSDAPLIYNNTIYGTVGNGIDVWGVCVGAQIKNNIIFNNTRYGIAFASAPTGYTVATNIIFNNTLGATQSVTGATGTIASDPLCTNPGSADFTLQAGSPAVNAGLNLGVTYQSALIPGTIWPSSVSTGNQNSYGAAWEIGAYVRIA